MPICKYPFIVVTTSRLWREDRVCCVCMHVRKRKCVCVCVRVPVSLRCFLKEESLYDLLRQSKRVYLTSELTNQTRGAYVYSWFNLYMKLSGKWISLTVFCPTIYLVTQVNRRQCENRLDVLYWGFLLSSL